MLLAELVITDKRNTNRESILSVSKIPFQVHTMYPTWGEKKSYVSSISLAVSDLLILLGAISVP